ncbi:MAG: MurR/RpiR family transcriptional regulator [Gammaproteobacteria bacterium]|nr:MurR/RpiR family transcriptional regulator [Gammaproteobacteria bacterium]
MPIRALIAERADRLTASERRIANAILADYPFAALVSIKELAQHTRVSAPSITRFVHKLGCNGYQDFQRALIDELRVGSSSPIDLKRQETALSKSSFLRDYTRRVTNNFELLAESVQSSELETICGLLSDPARSVYLVGGRLSTILAQYLSVHLKQIRSRVFDLSLDVETLPDDILRMRRQDVVLIFDFRRYQAMLERLASAITAQTSCNMVLVTDKWISPVGRYCGYVVPVPIETNTPWDSYAAAFGLIEALIVRISEERWDSSAKRIQAWDEVRAALGQSQTDQESKQ